MPLELISATSLAELSELAVMFRSLNPGRRASATVASSTPMRPVPPHQETSALEVEGLELTLVTETLELELDSREVSREVLVAGLLDLEVLAAKVSSASLVDLDNQE